MKLHFFLHSQRVIYLHDFDIVERVGGVDNVKEFNIHVSDDTLDIHLYWAGKVTITIPIMNVYGSLISAIIVTPSKHTII